MPVILDVRALSKAYGGQVLLDEVDLTLMDGWRIGVVGRNGAGKSTLCRILLGQEEADSGSVVWADGVRIAYLEQHDAWQADESVADYLQRRSQREAWKCGEVAGRLGLGVEEQAGPVARLSGGRQTRVKLATMLLAEPDLLVLDEPTNFLDLRTQLLLERFLANWKGACLVVSHDRSFLGATCDRTLVVENGRLTLSPHPVQKALVEIANERERLRRENANTEIKRKQLERFVERFGAKASLASRAKAKEKAMDRLEFHDIDDGDTRQVRMRVPAVERRDGPALRCDALTIGYPQKCIAEGIDLEIQRGDRVAILGDNGQGKTTLLRTLAGSLAPLAGNMRWTHGADLGVYAQHVYGTLPPGSTVRSWLRSTADSSIKDQEVLDCAGSFLFRGDAVDKTIGVLSGGERARMVLAGLMLGRHTVLVLDEPTNHLDVETVDSLAEAMTRYQGTLLVVTHDRDFARRVATVVIEVRDGAVRHFGGGIDDYLYRLNQENAPAPAKDRSKTATIAATNKPALDGRRERELRKAVAAAERRLERLTTDRATAESRLLACTDPSEATALQEVIDRLTRDQSSAETAWLTAQEALEG